MPMRAALAVGSKTLSFSGRVNKGRGEPQVGQVEGSFLKLLAENFLYAGSSAFLLLVANLFPHYWYLSFFALTPFLWRIIRLDAAGVLQLGLLFGFSFFSIWKVQDFFAAPVLTAVTVAFGTVLFALFAWAVARAKERFGFNPLFIALLWVLFELGLLKLSLISGGIGAGSFIPSEVEGQTHPFLAGETSYLHPSTSLRLHSGPSALGVFDGLSILFGFLAVSFVIVLVNSLLVFAIEKTVSLAKARGQGAWENESVWDLTPIPGLFAQKVYLIPSVRSPPALLRKMV